MDQNIGEGRAENKDRVSYKFEEKGSIGWCFDFKVVRVHLQFASLSKQSGLTMEDWQENTPVERRKKDTQRICHK